MHQTRLGFTEFKVLHEGFTTTTIQAEMCFTNWQESLMQLAYLVEPEILDDE